MSNCFFRREVVGVASPDLGEGHRSGCGAVENSRPSANGLNCRLRPNFSWLTVLSSKTVVIFKSVRHSTCAGAAVGSRTPARASAAPRASPIARTPDPRARFYAVQRRPRGLQRPCWREARGVGRGTGSFPNATRMATAR